MTEFTIEHEFAAEPDAVWQLVVDDDFNAELYARVQVDRAVLEDRDDAGQRVRRVRSTSRRNLPGFVQRLVGGPLSFDEEIRWRPGDHTLSLRVSPSILRERTRFDSQVAVEPAGPGRARRRFTGSIAIDLPLIGRRIEEGTVRDMRRIHDLAADLMRQRLARPA
jgi:hypothetical protein